MQQPFVLRFDPPPFESSAKSNPQAVPPAMSPEVPKAVPLFMSRALPRRLLPKHVIVHNNVTRTIHRIELTKLINANDNLKKTSDAWQAACRHATEMANILNALPPNAPLEQRSRAQKEFDKANQTETDAFKISIVDAVIYVNILQPPLSEGEYVHMRN